MVFLPSRSCPPVTVITSPGASVVRVPNRPRGRGHGHTLNTLDLVRFEVRVVDHENLWNFTSQAKGGGQRQVDPRGTHVRHLVYGQGGLMRDHTDHVGPTDLWPEDGLHVVAELGDGESCEPVDPASDPLDVALLGELHEADLMQAGLLRLSRGEIPRLVFRDSVEDGVPLAFAHVAII